MNARERPWAAGAARPQPGRAGGRDRGRGGRRGQRPVGAGGGHHRAARPAPAASWSTARTSPTARCSSCSKAGMAHVPEDRHGTGSAPGLSIADNLIMKSYRSRALARAASSSSARLARRKAQELKTDYKVDAPSIDTAARLLSGGNLQRLILAREITSEPTLIVAVQPTRGLDVGAIETVHHLLLAPARRGHRDPAHQRGARGARQPVRPRPGHLRGAHRGRGGPELMRSSRRSGCS